MIMQLLFEKQKLIGICIYGVRNNGRYIKNVEKFIDIFIRQLFLLIKKIQFTQKFIKKSGIYGKKIIYIYITQNTTCVNGKYNITE